MATIIDGVFVVAVFIAASHLLPQGDESSVALRFSVLVVFVFAYEPLLTSRLCTVGQLLTGIRVRDRDLHRLTVPRAFVRIALILILGWISWVTVPFTEGRRAVHDLIVGSVVRLEWAVDE